MKQLPHCAISKRRTIAPLANEVRATNVARTIGVLLKQLSQTAKQLLDLPRSTLLGYENAAQLRGKKSCILEVVST